MSEVEKNVLTNALREVHGGQVLPQGKMSELVKIMLAGSFDPVAAAGLLTALATRGEQVSEVVGGAQALRASMVPLITDVQSPLDTCGTGGTGRKIFNCSTAAAFVVAAAGHPVAKHGNRSNASPSGSADLLQQAGVRLDTEPSVGESALRELGICFMFAPNHHSAMRHIAPVRRSLGIQTLFNLLGPLCNPASVKHQVIGVAQHGKRELLALACHALGSERVLVVHALDGLDEISAMATTRVTEMRQGEISEWQVEPKDYLPCEGDPADLQVRDAADSLETVRSVLGGASGLAADMVVLNAAAALYTKGDIAGTDGYQAAVQQALATQRDGSALALLEAYARHTQA